MREIKRINEQEEILCAIEDLTFNNDDVNLLTKDF